MNMNRTLIMATVSAVISCSAYAGEVDWSVASNYVGTVDQSDVTGNNTSYILYNNLYGWDRNVSAWQSFQAGVSGTLGGIGVDLIWAQANGSVDLNIYAGVGVQGTLLESTALQWTDSFESASSPWTWCTFLLDNPVALTAGTTYTFSFENLGNSVDLKYVVDTSGNPYPNGEYMQQGYFMQSDYGTPDGYVGGTTAVSMNFETIMEPITTVPEPATLALAGLGGLSLLLFRRRK
jgi:hypothetical protein